MGEAGPDRTKLTGWGRFPVVECRTASCRRASSVSSLLDRSETMIPRGNGRSYGDAALNADLTLSMLGLDRFRDFDPSSGLLTCEAGVLLADILDHFVPRGWFPAVMPGTKFVTVGGMVAADVHGKNHHRDGTFGRHVEGLEIVLADGSHALCSRDTRPDLFHATLGGMGLTGPILSATQRLIPIETTYLREETLVAADLDQAMALLEESQDWTYSVAWVDCLAERERALISRGEHLGLKELPTELREQPLAVAPKGGLRVPLDAPSALLNGVSMRLFNRAYHALNARRAGERIVHFDSFFFPLDRLLDWNRLYGRRGFLQYQFVLPKDRSTIGLRTILDCIAAARSGSFLAVLKLLGPEGEGVMSFPMEGYTLALDFPHNRGTLELLEELDGITASHGGRVYLAKDARMKRESLLAGYHRLPEFEQIRANSGAAAKFTSSLSRRLML